MVLCAFHRFHIFLKMVIVITDLCIFSKCFNLCLLTYSFDALERTAAETTDDNEIGDFECTIKLVNK